MVIVIMGEVESAHSTVGARVAESLGWEFIDIEKHRREAEPASSMNDVKRSVELLRAALDSSIYEWRDVVLSCPVLTEEDQKHLRNNRSLVKFVYLKAVDTADSTLRVDSPRNMQICGLAAEVAPTLRCENGVLILASSMAIAQIVNAVLTGVVLQRSYDGAA